MGAEESEVDLSDIRYKRVLLKLSGEALMGDQDFGIDPAVPQRLAEEIKPVWEAGSLRAQAPLERVFDVEFIERNLETGDYVLLDGRSRERWAGQTEPIDPIAGHIPGALVRPSTENIGKDGLFKAPETLAEEFLAVINPASHADVINYCGSGVTACCNHLAMMIAGIPAAGVYIGSWSEWISDARRPINQTDKP